MNIEEIAQAMLDMAANEKMRLEMGETGYRRVMEKYRVEYMQKTYWEIYRDFAEQMGLEWKEESVKLPDKEKVKPEQAQKRRKRIWQESEFG